MVKKQPKPAEPCAPGCDMRGMLSFLILFLLCLPKPLS